MIALSLKKWNHSAGKIFILDRIYYHGYKWTPFCIIRIRNKPWYKSLVKPKFIVKIRPESIIN